MSHRKETEAMAPQPIEDCACTPWRKLERSMYRLQKRMCAMRRIEISLVEPGGTSRDVLKVNELT